MNHEDMEQVRLLIREELTPLKSELSAMKSDITEQMRDMQTELLRGLEAVARGQVLAHAHLRYADLQQ
jgi:hypothetical protein